MMETKLSHLLYGSSYFISVTFGDDSEKVNLRFGDNVCSDLDDDLKLDDLSTLIHMLSVARDELESRQAKNKETE
jgi:hypothetical protein